MKRSIFKHTLPVACAGVALVFVLSLFQGCGSGVVPYENDHYGYTLEYPAAWETYKEKDGDPNELNLKFEGGGTVRVTCFAPSNSTGTLEEQKDILLEVMNKPGGEIQYSDIKEQGATVAGVPAVKVTSLCKIPEGEWRRTTVIFVKDDRRFTIFYDVVEPSAYEANMDLFQKILDSLKLTR